MIILETFMILLNLLFEGNILGVYVDLAVFLYSSLKPLMQLPEFSVGILLYCSLPIAPSFKEFFPLLLSMIQ